MIQSRLKERRIAPTRILRVQFDEIPPLRELKAPIQEIVGWFQNRILGRVLNETVMPEPAFIFLDEVQNLHDQAPQLKSLVDHHTVQVLVTGA